MSNYSFKVKAILDGVDIKKQLENLSNSSMVPDVKLKLSGMAELSDLQKELLKSGGGVIQTYRAIGETFDVVSRYVKNLKTGQMELVDVTNDFAAAQKRADQATRQNIKNQQSIESLTIRVEGLTDAQKARINAEQRLKEISAETDIKKQAVLIQGFTKDLSAVSYGMMNFASSIDYTMKRFMEIGAITLAFRTIKNVVSDMVKTVSELDASLVEVQKVTDLTGKSLETFTDRAFNVGSEVARTGKEVIDATAIFARSGYEIEDALDLSKVAMIMMNVGDGIDSTSEAATSLISVLKGYNLAANEAIKVTDLINEVSNNAAINFEDLTEGLTRTSAVFNQAGVSIEKLSGLLTGTNEILQNVEMSSTGLITISQRCIYYTLIINHGAYVQKCA